MEISNKVALITGGASGLGLATAEVLVESGSKVMLLDLNEDNAKSAVEKLGSNSSYVIANVTDESSVQTAIDKTVEELEAKKAHITKIESSLAQLRIENDRLFGQIQQKDSALNDMRQVQSAQMEHMSSLKFSEDKVNGDREISALKLEIETLQSKINEMENNHEFHRQETSSKLVEHVKEIDFHKENSQIRKED